MDKLRPKYESGIIVIKYASEIIFDLFSCYISQYIFLNIKGAIHPNKAPKFNSNVSLQKMQEPPQILISAWFHQTSLLLVNYNIYIGSRRISMLR